MAEIKQKIKFLSEPSAYSMADEWYEIAKDDHFWVRLRFNILCKIAPGDTFAGRTLDIGCGHGVNRAQIEAHYNCAVDGCDLNLTALSKATPQRGDLLFYNIHDRREDLMGSFSAIVLFDILEHIEDPVEFLYAVDFHLERRGRLIINVPSLQILYSHYDLAAGHVKRYSLYSLRKELASAGFEIERAAYWGATFILLLLIRKLVLLFIPKDKVIQVGFKPSGKVATFTLGLFSRLEKMMPLQSIAGTSLMVVARKTERKDDNDG